MRTLAEIKAEYEAALAEALKKGEVTMNATEYSVHATIDGVEYSVCNDCSLVVVLNTKEHLNEDEKAQVKQLSKDAEREYLKKEYEEKLSRLN